MSSHIIFVLVAIVITLMIVIGVFVVPNINLFRDPEEVLAFEWEVPTIIYFAKSDSESKSCEEVLPVERMILNAETLGPGSFEKLIMGPNEDELSLGYTSFIPKGLQVKDFKILDGVAYISLDKNPAQHKDECSQSLAESQIKRTLLELPDIDEVVIVAEEREFRI